MIASSERPPESTEHAPRSASVARLVHHGKIVGGFAGVQVLVQVLGFISGILLVHKLDQREYAYFTIANTMQGTINLLADIGISIGLVSIGGRVWQDAHRFGQLINTALELRRKLGIAAILVVTPVLYLMLVRNGAPVLYTFTLIALILFGLAVQLSLGVFTVVPRLHSEVRRIQSIDFAGAVLRLAALGLLTFVFLNAGLAVCVGSLTILAQYWMLRGYVARTVDLSAPSNADDRQAMRGFVKNQAANALFYCFQGQITVFLITFFSHRVAAVAEVGALGRLAMIFTIISNLLANIFVPAFARCQDRSRLRWQYATILCAVASFSLCIIAGAAFLPNQFLFILGHKYAHLQRELLLMVAGAVVGAFTGTVWSLNAARAWVRGSWLYIPTTLLTQLALIPFTDFGSVPDVLIFNLISALPNLLLNFILSLRGFRSLAREEAFA